MLRHLCFIGDSFVQGCGDPALLGWVGRLCAPLAAPGRDLTVYNLGIRGQTSSQIRRRWRAEAEPRLPAGSPAGLVFSFGANDSAQAVPPAETLAHTAIILAEAMSIAPTLMLGPPPIADDPAAEERLARLCPALAEVARRLSVPYLPVHAALRHDPAWRDEALANDGAHPAAAGYAALARLAASWPAWRAWFA